MSSLSSITGVRALLTQYGLKADKAFGQNFLVDAHALNSIVEAADIKQGDTVLEIGPGLGVLSQALADKATKLIAVELDNRLIKVLKETLKDFSNLDLIHGDGLEYDFNALPKDSLLVANLPYNVATAIIGRALESGRFKRLVCLVQKEVADRLMAQPGSKAFGSLSLLTQYFGTAKRIRDVKPNSFFPAPEVTSTVVRIDVNATVQPNPELFNLIHLAFRHRRKTLRKNLLMAGFAETKVVTALSDVQLDAMIRAEAMSLQAFQHLLLALQAS